MHRLPLRIALPLLLIALLLPARAATSAIDPCRSSTLAPSSPVSVTSDGDQRDAVVHTPAGQKAGRRAALVLALHGSKGDGAFMEHYSGFSAVADKQGFVVAYPSAAGPWSDFDPQDGARNVRCISSLIDLVEMRWCVDPQRVFVVGISAVVINTREPRRTTPVRPTLSRPASRPGASSPTGASPRPGSRRARAGVSGGCA